VVHNFKTTLDWLKDDIFYTHTSEYHDIDYTAGYATEKLNTLASAITTSAAAVSMAEVETVSDMLEAAALGRELAGAPNKYSDNRVVYALFGHQAKRKIALQQITVETKLDECLENAIAQINSALKILTEKATRDELQQYKELLQNPFDIYLLARRLSSRCDLILQKQRLRALAFDPNPLLFR